MATLPLYTWTLGLAISEAIVLLFLQPPPAVNSLFSRRDGSLIAVELGVVVRHIFRLVGHICRVFDLGCPLRFYHRNHGIGSCLVGLLSRSIHRESRATGRRD